MFLAAGKLFRIATIVFAVSRVSTVNAAEKPSIDELRLAEFENAFAHTGELRNCINVLRIRDIEIINRQHILFRLSHGEYVLNKLPQTCWSLRRNRALAYAPTSMRLCSVDTVTVLDNVGYGGFRHRLLGYGFRPGLPIGPRCGLGKFEVVTRRDE